MIDWAHAETALRDSGYASLGTLLDAAACRTLSAMYEDPEHFRSRIDMARYRFGRGEYQYFNYPLPGNVAGMRSELYAGLAPIAERWSADLGKAESFPADHDAFVAHCHQQGQLRPTPLVLRYREGDYNCLHQDLYGDVYFPFQVVFGLSVPKHDYDGGELLLVEQRPRAQSMGTAIQLQQGEGVVITTRYRPVKGTRGFYRASLKHGVSPVRRGERFTLGIIFHDAA